jgi:hypothetical protein
MVENFFVAIIIQNATKMVMTNIIIIIIIIIIFVIIVIAIIKMNISFKMIPFIFILIYIIKLTMDVFSLLELNHIN